MNKIVLTHHIKAEELPAHLRGDIPPETYVNVRVEGEPADQVETLATMQEEQASQGHFSRFRAVNRNTYQTLEDVNNHIAALRNEWDRPT